MASTGTLDSQGRQAVGSDIQTMAAPDPGHFRRVLGHYPTGVCVVTGLESGEPVGMTVGSFTSLSLDPPLVAFMPMRDSTTFNRIANTRRFCVNVLAADQEPVCRHFASRAGDKFGGMSWRESPLGSPVLDDVLAWIDCELVTTHEAGDHTIVIGEVKHLDVSRTVAPLMFFQGGYGRFSALSLVAGAEDDLSAQLRLAAIARPHLERIAQEFGVEAHTNALAGDRVIQLAWVGQDSDSVASRRVGLRLPFAPPMGLLFVAWAGQDARDAWLARSGRPVSDQARTRYEEACHLVREQGWLATPAHDRLADVEDAVLRLAAEGHLPSLERDIVSALDDYSDRFATVDPDCWVDQPSGLSVPVFDHNGKVALAMSVQGLAHRAPEGVDRCLKALTVAAAQVTIDIGGTMPACGDEAGR